MKLLHVVAHDEAQDLNVFFEPVAVSAILEAPGTEPPPPDRL